MKIVRFIRKDSRPVEEYYYHSPEDAQYHFSLFHNDESGLYRKITIIDSESGSVADTLCFE